MEFKDWMREVDGYISRIAGGLVSADLADQTWQDWFGDGYSPAEAAREALENEGFEG